MTESAREELLRLQKKLYRKNRQLIHDSVIATDPHLINYEATYLKHVKKYQRLASFEELDRSLEEADIIYVGDYHTHKQSQRSFLRLLRRYIKKDRHPLIAMEVIGSHHQKQVEAYLKGSLSDRVFLKKIGFRQHWFFDLWQNFRPLFDFARYHQLPIFGIEAPEKPVQSVEQRDVFFAEQITELFIKNPERKIFVFVGDWHIAPQHLPRQVDIKLASKKLSAQKLILYQNSDAIYWQLAKKELEHQVELVKVAKDAYCRMHTPPILCQQSFLNWIDQEEGEFDYADAKITFLGYLEQIAKFLSIKLGPEKDEFEVYTCGDLSFLKRLRESGFFSPDEMKVIKSQILRSESYVIPRLKIVYLAHLSVNHAAEEAAHTLRNLCAGNEFPRPMQDAFYANIIHEALAFFGSKIINHKRKCSRYCDFVRMAKEYAANKPLSYEDKLTCEVAELFIEHENKQKKREPFHPNKIKNFSTDLFLALTHAIAYALGEKMFHGMLEGVLSRQTLAELHYDPMVEEGEALWRYYDLEDQLKGVKLPRRS